MPAVLSEGFRRTGTLHVLALSGLHVGIIYGLVLAALSFLRARAARIGIACAVVVVYQVFAGFMPSLSRATLMILAAALASALDRDREPLNLLALSGIVVLAVDPFQAFSVSFQLSYLALAGILAIGPLVQRPLAGHIPRVLLAPLAASIGAQVATLPVVITVFGAWYPSGILAGIVLVPLVTVFLGLGLGWLVLSPLLAQGPVQAACAAVFGALYRVIEGTATTLGRLPGIVPGPESAAIIAAIAGLLAAAAGLLLPLRLAPIPAGPDGRGEVSWLDEMSGGLPERPAALPSFNPDSPAEIRAALEVLGLGLKKRWGQNFLVNRGARERLVASARSPARRDGVGDRARAGQHDGLLLERGVRLSAFEVDRGLCRYLGESLTQASRASPSWRGIS